MNESKTKVLHYKHLPLRGPINTGLLWWIALEYFQATPIVWGAVCTIFGLYTIVWLKQVLTEKFATL